VPVIVPLMTSAVTVVSRAVHTLSTTADGAQN
jgi:hypothetical protein